MNHITKEDFLWVYPTADVAALTEKNIRSGFAASGLVPHDPEVVLSLLPAVVQTQASSRPSSSSLKWEPKTPGQCIKEVTRQAQFIEGRRRINKPAPSPSDNAFGQLLKAHTRCVAKCALLGEENKVLKAETAHQKRKRAQPRNRIQEGGVISIQDGQDILQQQEVDAQVRKESQKRRRQNPPPTTSDDPQPRRRHCKLCNEPGHNSRTCLKRQGQS